MYKEAGMKGFSLWLSFGKYAGWKIEFHFKGPTLLRIVLGWMAFVAIAVDVDRMIGTLALKAELGKLKIE
jgi:hypothetical protein